MIDGVLTTCQTQYIWDRSIQLHRLIKKFSKFSFMMCGVQYLCISPGTESTNQNRHWNHHRWHATNGL